MNASSMLGSFRTRFARLAWPRCFGAGLVLVALTVISLTQPSPKPCGNLAKNYAPIIAFELARSSADLSALFGAPGDACRKAMSEHMDAINTIDVMVFIPVYGFFLLCFFVGMKPRSVLLADAGFKLTILAVVSDYVENLCLMNFTPQLDPASWWFAVLPWATGAKWLGLGLAAAVAGLILIQIKPRVLLIAGAPAALICWTALLVTGAALSNPASYGPMLSPAIGASWLVMMITAAVETLRFARTAR